MLVNITHNVNAKEGYKLLDDNSINTIVTSPPYYGLRDYGNDEQIGLEKTPEEYVNNLVEIFRKLKPKLRDDGTLWLNLGDTYSATRWSNKPGTGFQGEGSASNVRIVKNTGLKNKDLIGIPWMVAFALRSDGWYLRQDIIWNKPNPMPESVTDRCTKAHEYIFLFSKSSKYYFDQQSILEPLSINSILRLNQNIEDQKGSERVPNKTNGNMKSVTRKKCIGSKKLAGTEFGQPLENYDGIVTYESRNKRSVWTVTTKPFSEAHFATYPEELIKPCILAGCPDNGIVLDPFNGAGTTGIVANKYGRNYIGFEINPNYMEIENRRRQKELGMFNRQKTELC